MPIQGSLCAVALIVTCWANEPAPATKAPRPVPRLGMNLAGVNDWSSELPFADVFRSSRPWISQKEGAGWGQGPPLDLDSHGWVKRLEPGCWAETLLCTIDGGHYPSGDYVVLYEGKGSLDAGNAGRVKSRSPGRVELEVDARKGSIFLRIRQTDPADPVRAIRVLLPGMEEAYRENPWNPRFLERFRGVTCLRLMDLMATNNSKVRTWSDRPTQDDATFAEKGVAAEWLCDLANLLNADAWFCIPHQADDGYVRSLALLVKQRLKPGHLAYIEYSNEVWNGTFDQHRHAGERGRALGFADKSWEAAWRYTAFRSMQIFAIWEEVFGGRNRLVRVLASQAANAYVSEQVLSFREASRHADALAIAPYMTFLVAPDGKPGSAEVAGWSVDRLLDHLERNSLPESIDWIRKSRHVADRHGLKLVAYEGGQHMVGVLGAENNEVLTSLLTSANASPRIEPIYAAFLNSWVREGGDLFCHFSSVGAWSKWGSWGLLQYADDDPSRSPKFRAVMRWAAGLGQPVNVSVK